MASEIPPAVQRLRAYLAAWILLLIVWSRGWSDRDRRELGWLLLLKDKHGLGGRAEQVLGTAAETGGRDYRAFGMRVREAFGELGTALALAPEYVTDERTSGKHCPAFMDISWNLGQGC